MKTRLIHEVGARVVTQQWEAAHQAAHVVARFSTYIEALARMNEKNIFDNPSLWPKKCDHCEYLFVDSFRSVSPQRIYNTSTGKPEPGDLFFEPCRGPDSGVDRCYHWDNCNGLHLHAIVPTGEEWDIDSRGGNCTMSDDRTHRCWIRSGEPPNVTAGKAGHTCTAGAGSIQTSNYHGMLQNGEFSPDASPLHAPPTFSWDEIRRGPCGKIKLLYRHERVFAEPFTSAARDVLDVGGWGVFATRMIEEGKNCTILDKFTADQYYAERVRALPHKKGDVRDPSCFASKSFDLITCFECLEHVGGIEQAIASMHSWLRSNGWLVGTVPIPGATHPVDEPGIEFVDETSLHFYLVSLGFVDIRIEPTVSIGLFDEQPSSLYFRARKT